MWKYTSYGEPVCARLGRIQTHYFYLWYDISWPLMKAEYVYITWTATKLLLVCTTDRHVRYSSLSLSGWLREPQPDPLQSLKEDDNKAFAFSFSWIGFLFHPLVPLSTCLRFLFNLVKNNSFIEIRAHTCIMKGKTLHHILPLTLTVRILQKPWALGESPWENSVLFW